MEFCDRLNTAYAESAVFLGAEQLLALVLQNPVIAVLDFDSVRQ
jgi:hypothetical protein